MQTTVEPTDKHKVRLTIEVPEEDFAKDLDSAYRRVAQQVRIPGFRKGKVPRRIIDAQIGRDAVMEEFLSHAVPDYYREAVREEDIAPITDPDFSFDQVEEGKPLVITAEVEVRPRLDLTDYKGIEVERPTSEPSDEDVESLVERLRERFAELETVSRPAREGDFVVADIRATVHEEEVPEATRPDYLYAVGSGEFGSTLDEEVTGKRAGEILKFNETLGPGAGEHAGDEVSFSVLVKEVKGKKLPPVDDGLAKTVSEFDTLDELRDGLREQVRTSKEREADAIVRDRVLGALVDRVEVDLPETLVEEETESRLQAARERATRAGTTLDEALAAQGWDELRLRGDARDHAIRAIKTDLVLEAVARTEELEVTAEEIGAEISLLASQLGRDSKELATTLDRTGGIVTLAGDIIRSKALGVLVDSADVTSGGDRPAATEGPSEGSS
jgi:trigger factor